MKALHVVCWLAVCSITSTLGADPFLEGHVTDEHGRPIEGASVTIADCIGSFCSNTTVLTDVEGYYVFEEKPYRSILLCCPYRCREGTKSPAIIGAWRNVTPIPSRGGKPISSWGLRQLRVSIWKPTLPKVGRSRCSLGQDEMSNCIATILARTLRLGKARTSRCCRETKACMLSSFVRRQPSKPMTPRPLKYNDARTEEAE